jgi:hypothetical protein
VLKEQVLTAKEQARVGKEQQPIIKNATFKKEEHSLEEEEEGEEEEEEEEEEDLLSAWPANVATLGCISSRLHDCASALCWAFAKSCAHVRARPLSMHSPLDGVLSRSH